ncbi:MAG: PQQ-dependent sugar dehydrogenase [Deltaproteobacteria bacterium]|nr:PQQ-dependent sugar dehydrogenase [Deltaproteobacteria bacterium]
MKKTVSIVISILVAAAGLAWVGIFYYEYLRGAGPAFKAPPRDISELVETAPPPSPTPQTALTAPLKLPPGFTLSIFARNLGNPRVLCLDPNGNLLVSLTGQGKVVALPDRQGKGVASEAVTVLKGLKRPHGLAFGPGTEPKLYVAETTEVAVYDYDPEKLTATNKQKIIDLPKGGRHFTRTLHFRSPPPRPRLLISVGSSCDTCVEKDWRYASILVAEPDGSHLKTFASGLRNSVFMASHPVTGHVWATEMGRDFLGEDLPPDEINIVLEGQNYGWPYCYGKRKHDDEFDPEGAKQDFCKSTVPSYIDIPAHSAPLGLAFFPEEWPKEYRFNLLVAYHGSWNRAVPTGYKVVRYKLDEQGNYQGEEDFITGWLTPDGALGRPADILITYDGVIFISDDKAGVVYRVVHGKMVKYD